MVFSGKEVPRFLTSGLYCTTSPIPTPCIPVQPCKCTKRCGLRRDHLRSQSTVFKRCSYFVEVLKSIEMISVRASWREAIPGRLVNAVQLKPDYFAWCSISRAGKVVFHWPVSIKSIIRERFGVDGRPAKPAAAADRQASSPSPRNSPLSGSSRMRLRYERSVW